VLQKRVEDITRDFVGFFRTNMRRRSQNFENHSFTSFSYTNPVHLLAKKKDKKALQL
jgi:hypothetical protein